MGQIALYSIDFDYKTAELGRIIKGERECPKGMMTLAAETLVRWGFDSLKLEKIVLEVFADNKRAISMYKRLGFYISNRVPFRMTRTPQGTIRWISAKNGEVTLYIPQYLEVYEMTLQKRDLKI
jgi:RimJ/RimL family protein N-acetyltransferase